LRLVITEELRETTYLDRVALMAVTHPRGSVIYNDESTRQGDFEPLAFWVLRAEDQIAPRAVSTERRQAGRPGSPDGLPLVAARDGAYLHAYGETPPQWAGWVPEHAIDIELPAGLAPAKSLLLLTGRIYWPDSSLLFALNQHGRGWRPPRLEGLAAGYDPAAGGIVSTAAGGTVSTELGFPCGMDRTMVVPLAGFSESRRFQGVRLVATHRFLWDEIAFAREAARVVLAEDGVAEVDLGGEPVGLSRATLPLISAELRYHGFSEVVGNMELHEQTYDFSRTAPLLKFSIPSGRATRYGGARPLVEAKDDLLAVLVPGDGLFLEFEAPAAVRKEVTYFLLVTGWAKEGSFHNFTGRRIEPLPFHGMKGYPPPAGDIRSAPAAYARYLEEYQTRRLGE
jgi:hypothetical protein